MTDMKSLEHYTPIGLEPDAEAIRRQFAAAHGWENQYRLIIQLGKLLPALPPGVSSQGVREPGLAKRR